MLKIRNNRLFFCFLCFACINVFSQEINSKVSFLRFNSELMTDLIYNKINLIRDSLGARKLQRDDILTKAAQHHANYLVDLGQISSTQKNKKTETVMDRVNLFKGNYSMLGQLISSTYVGKNVLLKKENRKVIYETYDEVADGLIKDLFQGSQNLINKNLKLLENNEFSNIGIAIGIDEPSKKIYTVMVLGNKPYTLPTGITIPPNAYGILPFDDKKCEMCKNYLKTLPRNFSLRTEIRDKKIYLKSSHHKYLYDLISNYVDAITIDILDKEQFDCNDPNVLHKSEFHDGVILPPIKRKTLLKNIKKMDEGGAEIFFY